MSEITSDSLVQSLRRCNGNVDCEGCGYAQLAAGQCMRKMQGDAAQMIEALQCMVADQASTIFKLRKIVAARKPK